LVTKVEESGIDDFKPIDKKVYVQTSSGEHIVNVKYPAKIIDWESKKFQFLGTGESFLEEILAFRKNPEKFQTEDKKLNEAQNLVYQGYNGSIKHL
jgi:hypothetical protein